ncbi:MAG: hypothetical protein P1U56_22515 [Saprospiraceae bacterium]|nr:hypothetical protein [Saprospiraceae bacterium]
MNRILLIAILATSISNSIAQKTYEKGLFLRSQKDIQEFRDEYPNVEILNKYLLIGTVDTDIHDLSALSHIIEVKGDLTIRNTKLTSLEGLTNLSEVKGVLRIQTNSSLVELGDFEQLHEVGGDLVVNDNKKLLTLEGFTNLKQVGGNLFIGNNDTLVNLSGLENITSMNGFLNIRSNKNLKSLEALHILSGIKRPRPSFADIIIYNNPKLSHCHCQPVIEVLLNAEKYTDIELNDTGCANRKEIIEAYLNNSPDKLIEELIKNQPSLTGDFIQIEMDFNGSLILKDENLLEIERYKVQKGSNKINLPSDLKGIFSIWDEYGTMKYISKKKS